MRKSAKRKIEELLTFIYGEKKSADVLAALWEIVNALLKPGLQSESDNASGTAAVFAHDREGGTGLSEKDACLITYGDMLGPGSRQGAPEKKALARLSDFLSAYDEECFSYLHILPFHPYSSDDGFSVIDYRKVNPQLGDWDDIAKLGARYKLVFDLVLNHGSVQSRWFQSFLEGDQTYADWYIEKPENFDASPVFRPRTDPLFTCFTKADGTDVNVWTTFGPDQADYDFSNPEVLLEFIRVFLEYARHGARMVRLDAVAYLWKEDGTSCIHHPKTHAIVKLLRALVDYLELDLRILTETNVPHKENISYFGHGDEAHLVYNFALPPLVLHAALSEDARPLSAWARTLPTSDAEHVFFNFLASHDGIGVLAARDLIEKNAFQKTLEQVIDRGARVSYKQTAAGRLPYEINCSYLSAVAPPSLGDAQQRARIFLCCNAVLCALAGLPAIYFHSWVGSQQWSEGPALHGYNRAINREKPDIDRLQTELANQASLRSLVHTGFKKMLQFRKSEAAFAPDVAQTVLDSPDSVFALARGPDRSGRHLICLQNFANDSVSFNLDKAADRAVHQIREEGGVIELLPHETRWIAYGGEKAIAELRL